MSTKIIYHDTAVYDKSRLSVIDTSSVMDFSDLTIFETDSKLPDNFVAFDKNGMKCGKKYQFYDSTKHSGFQSNIISDSNGEFTETPTLTLDLQEKISSVGITLKFSLFPWIYCKKVRLTWTKSDNTNVQQIFYPDYNVYFCDKSVENYNKIKIELLQTQNSYQYARVYGVDFGKTNEYSSDNNNVISLNLNNTANIIMDELTLNSAEINIIESNFSGFEKKQKIDIYHNENFISSYFTDDISIGNKIIYISGTDSVGICNSYTGFYGEYYTDTFEHWLNLFYFGGAYNTENTIIDSELKNVVLSGFFENDITKRVFLQKLCFAAGAFIDTTTTDRPVIRSVNSLFNSNIADTIDEKCVFEGDTTEIKPEYKYLILRWKDSNGTEQMVSATNPNSGYSTATKDFTLDIYPNDMTALLNLYKKYYFSNTFYNAKAVVGYEHIGSMISINGKKVISISRKYNLDGEKLIAQGVYKCQDT